MRIGFFTDSYFPQIHGVSTSIKTLKDELEKMGHEVYIITVNVKDYKEKEKNIIRLNSIAIKRFDQMRLLMPSANAMLNRFKKYNFDIIHTHTEFLIGILGKRVAKRYNIKHVHTYHTLYEYYTHYIYNKKFAFDSTNRILKKSIALYSKLYMKNADLIIAPSIKTKNVLKNYNIKENIIVQPTGINLLQFENKIDSLELEEVRKKYNLKKTNKHILVLGRISIEKSIDFIIDSFKEYLNNSNNLKLLIVGDGPHKSELEKYVEDNNIKNILFTGRVKYEDVKYFYNISDVFISASKSETQGLTIIEAIASNTDIILYNDENITDLVIDNKSGRLFNNKKELLDAFNDFLNDKEKNEYLKSNAKEKLKEFSKEVFAENIENYYLNLLE